MTGITHNIMLILADNNKLSQQYSKLHNYKLSSAYLDKQQIADEYCLQINLNTYLKDNHVCSNNSITIPNEP